MMNRFPNDSASATPVILCGCGRSGTTYVKSVLDAHPKLFIPTESLFLMDYLRYERHVPSRLLSWFFFKEPQLRSWYSGPCFRIRTVREAIIRVHMDMAKKRGATRWGQKTPRFIRSMNLVNRTFQGTQWILIYRDPRAVTASMLKSKRHTYSVSRACARWNRDNRTIIELVKDSSSRENIFILKYEDVIAHFSDVLVDLFQFLGLHALNIHEVLQFGSTPGFKGSKFEVNAVREGLAPQKEIMNHWKRVLTEEQIRKIEILCASGMKALGYDFFFPQSNAVRTLKKAKDWTGLKDVLILFEYLKKWPSYLLCTFLRKMCFLFCYCISNAPKNE